MMGVGVEFNMIETEQKLIKWSGDNPPLTFEELREANSRRQEEWAGEADLEFRAIEFAGESGELMEAIKKYLRNERGIQGSTATLDDIADEMGDLIIALNLLAMKLDIPLDKAVTRKFNATSEKYGLETRI